jgi:hypothetical protein
MAEHHHAMGDLPGHRRGNGNGSHGGDAERPPAAAAQRAHWYTGGGSPEAREAADEEPRFARGGRKKRKSGGSANGALAAARMDRARRATGGNTPYSSAHRLSAVRDTHDASGRGKEGAGAAGRDMP